MVISEKQEEKSIVEVFSNLTRFNVGSDIDINNDLADFNTKVALIYDNEFYVNITVGQSQDITGKRLTRLFMKNSLKNSLKHLKQLRLKKDGYSGCPV